MTRLAQDTPDHASALRGDTHRAVLLHINQQLRDERAFAATERRERLATFFRSQRGRFQIACIATALLSAGYVAGRVLL